MINWLKGLFAEKINPKKQINLSLTELDEIKEMNRATLGLIDNWIDDLAFKHSFFNYGVPDFIRSDINRPIGNEITYTDVMLLLSKKNFGGRINYLELGVSVGKNFFQMLNSRQGGTFTGFDIEEINPVLEGKLVKIHELTWPTPVKSIKKSDSSLKKYSYNDKEVSYISADIWDAKSWEKLKGNKYNLIFSDALHSPQAILFEFDMLVRNELLDSKFIIVWDDLEGKMKNAFFKIIRKYDRIYHIKDIYLLKINGWIGENERAHTVGIISNFPIT